MSAVANPRHVIFQAISQERDRQDYLHPEWPWSGQEVGWSEVRAMLTIAQDELFEAWCEVGEDFTRLADEVTHFTSVGIRILERLNQGKMA